MMVAKPLLLVLFVLYYCTTVSTDQYYVVVAENTTDCLPADGECHPLSFYVAHSSSYFTDNTIFYFKKGTHTVMDSININTTTNLSIIGLDNNVSMHCSNGSITICHSTHININKFSQFKCVLEIYNSYGVKLSSINTTTEHELITLNVFDFMIDLSQLGGAKFQYTTLQEDNYNASSQNYSVSIINSSLDHLEFAILHGMAYYLNVTLDSVSVENHA